MVSLALCPQCSRFRKASSRASSSTSLPPPPRDASSSPPSCACSSRMPWLGCRTPWPWYPLPRGPTRREREGARKWWRRQMALCPISCSAAGPMWCTGDHSRREVSEDLIPLGSTSQSLWQYHHSGSSAASTRDSRTAWLAVPALFAEQGAYQVCITDHVPCSGIAD